MKQDHYAKAKDYIAIAESPDAKVEAYHKAADEIEAAKGTQVEAAREVEKSEAWVSRLLQWHLQDPEDSSPPFGGSKENEARYERQARTILKDPERRRQALAGLPAAEVEAVIEDANEVAMDRVRAKRSEHQTQPTTGDLMGDDPFHPDEFWADNVIIRINRNARELASLIQRGGGLILGAMEVDRAFDYLNEAEQLIAEARAAAQEQSRDKAGVS